MGSKWFLTLTVLAFVQGVSATPKKARVKQEPAKPAEVPPLGTTYEDILRRCKISPDGRDAQDLQAKQENPDNPLQNNPIVPMNDEINRRLTEKFGKFSELRRTPVGAQEFIQQYFARNILKDSQMLQVDQDDQARLLAALLSGGSEEDSGWHVLEKNEAPKIEDGRFISGRATMQTMQKDKLQTYEVACVNLGRTRRAFSRLNLSDDSVLCSMLRDMENPKTHGEYIEKFIYREKNRKFMKEHESLWNEDDLWKGKLLKKKMFSSDVYACFLSQSGT